jgi:hypothetical protein
MSMRGGGARSSLGRPAVGGSIRGAISAGRSGKRGAVGGTAGIVGDGTGGRGRAPPSAGVGGAWIAGTVGSGRVGLTTDGGGTGRATQRAGSAGPGTSWCRIGSWRPIASAGTHVEARGVWFTYTGGGATGRPRTCGTCGRLIRST